MSKTNKKEKDKIKNRDSVHVYIFYVVCIISVTRNNSSRLDAIL